MNNKKDLEAIINRKYPVAIHFVVHEGGNRYYLAFLPDFSFSTCSATGDTEQEALNCLKVVKREIIEYYLDSGKEIPEPTLNLKNIYL